VQTLLCHTATTRVTQPGIGVGAAVAGNYLERLLAGKFLFYLEKQVEQLRVDAADLAGVMVAQEKIQAVQRIGDIVLAEGETTERRSPV
jgi:hypothetical protein